MLDASNFLVNPIGHIFLENDGMALQDRINELFKEFLAGDGKPKKNIDLAKACGVTRTTPSDWRSGKTSEIKGGKEYLISDFFGGSIEPQWIATGRGNKYKATKSEPSHNVKSPLNASFIESIDLAQKGNINLTHTLSSIPVFKWHDLREVDVAKGVVGSLMEVERFSATSGVTAKTFAVHVVGNLMAPVFREGMLLTVEPTIQPNHEDFVVALDASGEPVLKQYIKDGGEEYLITISQQNLVKPYQGHTLLGVVTASTSVFRQI